MDWKKENKSIIEISLIEIYLLQYQYKILEKGIRNWKLDQNIDPTISVDSLKRLLIKNCIIFLREQTELTPIENATEMILSKNKELDKTVNDFSTTSKTNINPLSMILNGVIDANVNGGIANYQSVCRFYDLNTVFCIVIYYLIMDFFIRITYLCYSLNFDVFETQFVYSYLL